MSLSHKKEQLSKLNNETIQKNGFHVMGSIFYVLVCEEKVINKQNV